MPATSWEILVKLREQNKNWVAVHSTLGSIYWEQNKLPEAISCFEKAVSLSPTDEVVSMALFHCRFDSGDKEGAASEMKRFCGITPSREYNILKRLIDESQ